MEFSILTNPSNVQRTKLATIVQDDLAQLGMQVHVVPLEFPAVMARIFDTYDYEAAVLGLVSGDADPNPEINVWTSSGATHLWALTEKNPTTDWQAEIDRLMRAQTSMLDYQKRKRAYDRVQELIAQFDPWQFRSGRPHACLKCGSEERGSGVSKPASDGAIMYCGMPTRCFGAATSPEIDECP